MKNFINFIKKKTTKFSLIPITNFNFSLSNKNTNKNTNTYIDKKINTDINSYNLNEMQKFNKKESSNTYPYISEVNIYTIKLNN
jgi:hypothetical protein